MSAFENLMDGPEMMAFGRYCKLCEKRISIYNTSKYCTSCQKVVDDRLMRAKLFKKRRAAKLKRKR